MINLVSDTVTRPDKAMISYMMSAEVGDDVFGEDPAVNALEEKVADLFGKEAALFCASGTMTNQIAIKVHTRPLDEMICDQWSHVYQYEVGGYAYHSAIAVNPLPGIYGKITARQIDAAIKPTADWLPRTRLVVLENSTNKGGGNLYTLPEIAPVSALCRERGLALHLDGARLFNVLIETGETTREVGRHFDSISICLSKGLGAPVGSVLTGERDFIREARRVRKVMGGGMRQAGYLAAACIYALDNNIPQLKVDNNRAKILGEMLSRQGYVKEVLPVRTNIIIFELANDQLASDFLKRIEAMGLKASHFGLHSVRLVLHRDITEEMFQNAVRILDWDLTGV